MKKLIEKFFGQKGNANFISNKKGCRVKARHLLFETLEERQMLVIFPADFNAIKVTYPDLELLDHISDYNVIEITSAQLSEQSLRDAIAEAGNTEQNDLIVVRTTATQHTITLSGQELAININAAQSGSVTMVSFGDEKLTIDADQKSRVFNINNSTFALAGLNVVNGNTTNGSGIYTNNSLLTVTDCTFSENRASNRGGGIYNSGGLTRITHTTFIGNFASLAGGGIDSYGQLTVTDSFFYENESANVSAIGGESSSATITNCVISRNIGNSTSGIGGSYCNMTILGCLISDNTATTGGGIGLGYGCTMTIADSMITGNTAASGGGINNQSGTCIILNSVISQNTATNNGGGIFNGATTTMTNCTIADNMANGLGDGIYNASTLNLCNTIVAGNSNADIYQQAGTIQGFNNLSTFNDWGSDSGNNFPYDPELPLFVDAKNGDFRLAPGSQAIDKGSIELAYEAGLTGASFDFAAEYRYRGYSIDIGAYEFQDQSYGKTHIVTTQDDDVENDGNSLSLRKALEIAHWGDFITFDESLRDTTIFLEQQLVVDRWVTIDGGDLNITLDGQNQTRLLSVSTFGLVEICGLSFTQGSVTGNNYGGAIYNTGHLTLTNCRVIGNTATAAHGGGIYSAGTLTIVSSTIADNRIIGTGSFHGGGIASVRSDLTLIDSVVSGNTTYSSVGGVWFETDYNRQNTLTILGSEISDNHSTNGDSGGVHLNYGTLYMENSVVSGNTASGNFGGLYYDGYIYTNHSMTIIGCEFTDNVSGGEGGGLYIRGNVVQTITDTRISGNYANYGGGMEHNGGTLTISGCEITDNQSNIHGDGIYNSGGTLNIVNTAITGNRQREDGYYGSSYPNSVGGGVYNTATLNLTNVTIADNKLTGTNSQGGGIYNSGTANLTNVTISGNQLIGTNTQGGGIYNYSGTLTMTATTIEGHQAVNGGGMFINSGTVNTSYSRIMQNSTTAAGGGIYAAGTVNMNFSHTIIDFNTAVTSGGGVYSMGSTDYRTIFMNSNIVNNTASLGGGIATNSGRVYLHNTIVALNGDDTTDGPDVWTGINGRTMAASSLIGVGESMTGIDFYRSGSVVGTQSTPVSPGFVDATEGNYRLTSGSVAIDRGNDLLADGDRDYYGNVRIRGNRVDIGVFEYEKVISGVLETKSLIVTTLDDIVDSYDGKISLREALDYAQHGDTITFDPAIFASGGVISLAGLALTIDKPVTIDASAIAGGVTLNAAGLSQVIIVAASTGLVELKNLTLTGGYAAAHGGGLYIDTDNNVLLTDCVVMNNRVINSYGIAFHGGGIASVRSDLTLIDSVVSGNTTYSSVGGVWFETDYNRQNTLTILGSEISDNHSTNGDSGGVHLNYGTLYMENSVVSGNTASGNFGGLYYDGYIYTNHSMTIIGCEFTDNVSGGEGGGLYIRGNVVQTITDTRISGNRANYGGGMEHNSGTLTISGCEVTDNMSNIHGAGIYNSGGTLNVVNTAITGNRQREDGYYGSSYPNSVGGGVYNTATLNLTNVTIADNKLTGTNSQGGGIYNSGTANIHNTIIAENTSANSADIHQAGGTVQGYNNLTTFTEWNAATSGDNYTYASGMPLFVDAVNGNYQLMEGAYAIDRGSNARADAAGLSTLSTDLAGSFRFVGQSIDIGAYEYQGDESIYEEKSCIVTTLFDVVDFTDNLVSLREAVFYAQILGVTTITFSPDLAGQTIVLVNGPLVIPKSLTIDASTLYDSRTGKPGITISGNEQSRIIQNNGGTVFDPTVLIGLHLTDGRAADGAAIDNTGTLVLENSLISDSVATSNGGGIHNTFGANIKIVNSRFSNLFAANGGAIGNAGTLEILRSEFALCHATVSGGAVYNTSRADITETQFASCTATTNGGILFNASNASIDVNISRFTHDNTAAVSTSSFYCTQTVNAKAYK